METWDIAAAGGGSSLAEVRAEEADRMKLDRVFTGFTILGMPVWIGRGSQCLFVVVTDGLARAKTLEETPEAEVVKSSLVEAVVFAVELVTALFPPPPKIQTPFDQLPSVVGREYRCSPSWWPSGQK